MIDWRALFDSLGVKWKDRGQNVSKGWINICCPFCTDDPSEHMGIYEEDGHYSCWRNSDHTGGDPVWLLQRITRNRVKAVTLLDDFDNMRAPVQAAPKPVSKTSWDAFRPAHEDEACMDYLYHERGFLEPEDVSRRFDLRYATRGEYAQRLLLPLYDAHMDVIAWTGRTVANREPRYKAHTHPDMQSLVATGAAQYGIASGTGKMIVVLVEGPMDALKINAYSGIRSVLAVALTGLSLTDGRATLFHLWHYTHIFLCLDYGKPIDVQTRMLSILSRRVRNVSTLSLPTGYKDAGEINPDQINPWLQEAIREAKINSA